MGHVFFRRMEELESLLERVDHNSKCQIEELTAKLHSKTSESSGLSLENERLKVLMFFFSLHLLSLCFSKTFYSLHLLSLCFSEIFYSLHLLSLCFS